MATGFECEFVEKPPKAFQSECPICLLVLREPYQATCCGKSFCRRCIHRVNASNHACPTCNDKDFTLFPNKGLQQSLYDFRVYCTHKSKGCEWTGELRELDNHLNSDPPADKALEGCPYTLIKCPLGCAGCEKGVYRKDVKAHVNDKLLGHVMIQSARIKALEEKLCKINAELEAEREKGKRDKEHFEQRVAKLETKIGEPDTIFPMVSSKRQASSCPGAYVTGTYKPASAEFTVTHFEEYKRDGGGWFSPHFYTRPNGYKMCLEVRANGWGRNEGTHLSVFVCLMRGEFDDQLKWPFRGEVTITLLNQEENKDHVTRVVPYAKASDKHCQRVTMENCSAPWGIGKFLPLTELQPKYLKNDCIKLCIKKVAIV